MLSVFLIKRWLSILVFSIETWLSALVEYFWQVDTYPFLPLNHNYGPWFQTDILEISSWFVSFLFSLHLALSYLF